jgi:hypothetical protein
VDVPRRHPHDRETPVGRVHGALSTVKKERQGLVRSKAARKRLMFGYIMDLLELLLLLELHGRMAPSMFPFQLHILDGHAS